MKDKEYILLDTKIARDFHNQARQTTEYPLDCGAMSQLKGELMDLCGVTELEAYNILCGRNVKDYINKYTGQAEGRKIEAKAYTGDVQVVYRISEDEKDLFGWE